MGKLNKLIELTFPEYRERHIFTTKLRLAIFVGFWIFYLYFLKDVLGQTKVITGIICFSFLVTGLAYYNIVIRSRLLIISFLIELIADLTTITAVIYLTGGPYSSYYTVYIFYCFAAGVFYNHILGGVVALFCLLYYGAFLMLCHWGIISPLILNYGDRLPIPAYAPLTHFFFAIIFLGITVYAVKIASFFAQKRERMLELRNKELTALHDMSSTLRSTLSLKSIIDQTLQSIVDGLRFDGVILLLFNYEKEEFEIFIPKKGESLEKINNILGKNFENEKLPLSFIDTPFLQTIMRQEIAFRKDLIEATLGLETLISKDKIEALQSTYNIRGVVGIPLIVEKEILGVLIGFSTKQIMEDRFVQALESFANQAALSVEASLLIERLKKINEQLQEANRVKSEFLAIMGHELRTPLTAIIGFSELMLEGVLGDLNKEQQESLKEVLNNGADLLELINSLLDFSKLDSGKMQFDMHIFDLAEMIDRAQKMISSLVQRKKQKFLVNIHNDLLSLYGDEKKLQQVLLNLFSNAIKFTPEQGEISVNVKQYKTINELNSSSWFKKISDIKNHYLDGAVEISVIDSGLGIKEDHLEVVFDVFQQVDSSITRSYGGTGLGLALAKQYVEQHKGIIWVESEYGKGANFVIVLPNRNNNK